MSLISADNDGMVSDSLSNVRALSLDTVSNESVMWTSHLTTSAFTDSFPDDNSPKMTHSDLCLGLL